MTIYLDHAATTPLRPEALEAMMPYLTREYGNPSSIYRLAQSARAALDAARDTIAACLNANSAELIFTSGGTEANNAAIKGVAMARREYGRHIVTTAIEHHSVLHPIEELTTLHGFGVTIVPVGTEGIIDVSAFESELRPDTVLASVMWANNEIGTIQPIEKIASLTRDRKIPLHVDAVQAAGTLSIDLAGVPIDLLTISAHKFYGPKGVGALFIRRGTPWWPLLTGGGQERNRRAGTENVAGIVGMARALELAGRERDETNARLVALRDYLIDSVMSRIPGTVLNGSRLQRLPNNANFSFEGVNGEALLTALDLTGIMASSGSACTSGSLEPSHVLQALGLSDELAGSSVRLSLGRENAGDEIDNAVLRLGTAIERLRKVGPESLVF